LRLHHEEGPALYAELLHRFVWSQGLPNANHRSALALVNRLLFAPGTAFPGQARIRQAAERFIARSKPLIGEQEFAPDDRPLRDAHLQAAREYVTSVQSGNDAKKAA